MEKNNLTVLEEGIDVPLSFRLNGKEINLQVPPSRRLIDILREDLQLTGTKIGCEIGRCGACMVLINGEAFNSCLTMAFQCHEKEVITIEGIEEDKLDFIQQAFLEEGGFQCGYCTPGMIISLKAVMLEKENPSISQLKEGLAGNLCRCTGYGGIHRVLNRLVSDR
ncbi:2Fe-2S iron-sulfur cluster-binding protein [Evansella tamaricis]|uniref:2Fe-2S iron-sulfur cluster-binding protein n=1 Tax=Evansella tamaricis TaxID=2069301 RepID=UPI001FE5ABF5|nr:2Fe-2S iron-sulfur cluster-binding protein [Evansella tamaricis]